MRRPAGTLATALVAIAALAGCTTTVVPPSPSPAPATRPSASPSPSTLPSPGQQPPIDPTLLEHLPAAVDGLDFQPADESLAEAIGNPALARNADRVAAALAIDPGSGDFVFAALAHLAPGVMNAEFYRNWRDSFDAGACSRAGGVVRNADAEIGGRQVFIATCAEGVRTYHAWLADSGVLVSLSALGARNLGERTVEGLRD